MDVSDRATNLTGVVVDAPHGGTDVGATSGDMTEKSYALKISQYIYNRLKQLGVPVAITRNSDVMIAPSDVVKKVMNAFGSSSNVIVISNHLNAGGGDGAEIVYALRNNDKFSRLIASEFNRVGQNVRKWYQRRLPSDTSKDYYYIIRDTSPTEAVLIEYGYLDGPSAEVNYIKNHWQDMAEGVVRALAYYKNIPYSSPTGSQYAVMSGDSLYSIATKYNVSVDAIIKANNLKSTSLRIGQMLTIPGSVPPIQSNTTYVVQRGDSLYSVASAYQTTVTDLKTLNNLTSNTLQLGQILKIPGIGPITDEEDYTLYTVKSGDSIYSVATAYGTTATDLKNLNNLTSNVLSVGQVIKVPTDSAYIEPAEPKEPIAAMPGQNSYLVQKGDSLYSIASKFGVTVTSLRTANNLTSDLLQVGQVLIIPASSRKETEKEDGEVIRYTVQKGDSLSKIAARFGTNAPSLMALNKLTTNIIRVGQEILIPESSDVDINASANNMIYYVKSGDTLWSVAKRFGVTIGTIKKLNNLSGDTISNNQQLIVPVNAPLEEPPKVTFYIVMGGDTLYSIANEYNTTVDKIKELNNLDNNIISIGQILAIPSE